MVDEEDESGFAVEASTTGVKARVGRGFLNLVFPERAMRQQIDEAWADRISAKIRSGDSLDAEERLIDAAARSGEARKILRQYKTAQAADAVADEVAKLLPAGASGQDAKTSGTFWERLREDVGLTTDEGIRDIYARILAGETRRPGTFSLATLGVLRELDQGDAELFLAATRFVLDGAVIPIDGQIGNGEIGSYLNRAGFTQEVRLRLADARLLNLESSILAGRRTQAGQYRRHFRFGPWVIAVEGRNPEGGLPATSLTRAARELVRIAHQPPDPGLIAAIGAYGRGAMVMPDLPTRSAVVMHSPDFRFTTTWAVAPSTPFTDDDCLTLDYLPSETPPDRRT